MVPVAAQPATQAVSSTRPVSILAAVVIAGLTIAYTFGVVAGLIDRENRIDAVHLGILLLAALIVGLLLRPASLDRLKLLEMGGFKVEMLEQVKERQAQQASKLEEISFMLPLLLPETERKHLVNLDTENTAGYEGSGSLRAELRRLRSIGLISMRGEHWVGEITSGMKIDLADYVQLTALGRHWIRRIEKIEQSDIRDVIYLATALRPNVDMDCRPRSRPCNPMFNNRLQGMRGRLAFGRRQVCAPARIPDPGVVRRLLDPGELPLCPCSGARRESRQTLATCGWSHSLARALGCRERVGDPLHQRRYAHGIGGS